ncbi:Gfo/Idh/MocA family protein [Micromonospora sp. LOL_024]|uniref:Gfo/Idh/MocA family protein n=1 Tax=Micromonospora sp. LOL_024 TaxID=3345412 RepID=UPI003A868C0C
MVQTGPPRVALIGALGHGRRHHLQIHRLQLGGRLRLVAIANRRPVPPAADTPLDDVAIYQDPDALLADVRPHITVVCTPPHTHAAIAEAAVRAGSDLLLEKPPVVTLAEHDRLAELVEQYGVRCQVGFQSLGSPVLPLLTGLVAESGLTTISVAGAWWRPDSYFARTVWAGRRTIDGAPAADGALANQFAHALQQALALAAGVTGAADPVAIGLEWYRTRDIEVEDTARLAVTLAGGTEIRLAVTLASDTFTHGELLVRGDHDVASWDFTNDRLRLAGEAGHRVVPGRVGLLENLLDHRRDPSGVPLLGSLVATRAFTVILDALAAAPPPALIAEKYLRPHPEGGGNVVDGIGEVIAAAAQGDVSFSEAGAPWAGPAYRVPVSRP